MAMPLRIERLFAFVSTDAAGHEGVCAAMLPGMPGMTPLIGADEERVRALRPYAELVSRATGLPVRLVEFSTRRDLDLN